MKIEQSLFFIKSYLFKFFFLVEILIYQMVYTFYILEYSSISKSNSLKILFTQEYHEYLPTLLITAKQF
jgi:hypothetical protein